MGFYRVTIKGVRASEKEAPILALAPHSSFYDAFPVVLLTAPSLVVKQEVQHVPFFASESLYTNHIIIIIVVVIASLYFPSFTSVVHLRNRVFFKVTSALGYCLVP